MANTGEPVFYDERTCSFHCLHCDSQYPCPRSVLQNPERFVAMLEMFQIDHAECSTYSTVKLARAARRYRREMKRQQLLSSRRRFHGLV